MKIRLLSENFCICKINNLDGVNFSDKYIFVVSTYNTDYILIKENEVNRAIISLENEGYIFIDKE